MPQFIDCVGVPSPQPSIISLDCIKNSDQMRDITWTEWTADHATGQGTRVRVKEAAKNTTTETTRDITKDVTVELRNPVLSPQGLVFTDIIIEGRTYQQ